MTGLLSVDGLNVTFETREGRSEVVRGLSFELASGRTLGIVGESGSGKSMTSLAIMGLLPQGAQTSGQITFDGKELLGKSDREMRPIRGERIAMIFQDPLSSLNPFYTIGLQIEETYRAHRGGSRRAARAIALDALTRVGISDARHRLNHYPHQFSGGMRQRIMIAMALCLGPDLLIADEPTTALDVTVQARILQLLKELQDASGAAMLFISHDLAVVSQVADEVLVMRNGSSVEAGTTEQIFCNPLAPYTRELLLAVPRITDSIEVRDRAAAPLAIEIRTPPTPLLTATGLRKVYGRGPRQIVAVEEASFEVGARETLAIVGESGSGKSTTARMVAKLVDPSSGHITFDGADVTCGTGAGLARFRKDVQVVFQDPFSSLNPRHTIEHIISAPARYQGVGHASDRRAEAQQLMERVGLNPDHIDRRPWQFSGGQAQRIGIARALALRPRLVICDEAVSALDVSVQARILTLLGDLQEEFGLSYIFIAHDLAVVRSIADRVAVMSQGRIVETGSCAQIFDSPQDEYTKALLSAIPQIPVSWDRQRQANGSALEGAIPNSTTIERNTFG